KKACGARSTGASLAESISSAEKSCRPGTRATICRFAPASRRKRARHAACEARGQGGPMIENFFLALTLMMAAPRAPGVEITFTDAGAGGRVTRYRLPLPLDNQSTRLHFWESEPSGRQEITLRALLVKDKSGASWLDYDIKRQAGGRIKDAP